MHKKQYKLQWQRINSNKIVSIAFMIIISSWVTFWQCETENREDIRICDELENCYTLMDRNLWATSNNILQQESLWCTYQRWNNHWFPIWCNTNNCNDQITESANTTLAVRNNKYNDKWYTDWNNFITWNPDYRSDRSHDWLRGWINDSEVNDRWEYLSEIDDVYDVDIFRQWPCPKWYHVPNLWEWTHVLDIINNDVSEINISNTSIYRDYTSGQIKLENLANFWTSSPVSSTSKAKAINKDWTIKNIDRSMWLQIRCFRNKRDAMVWVWTWTSDIVFFDTQVPSINKIQWEDITLLNYTGDTAIFKQQVKISENIRTWTDTSYLFLQACQDLRNSYLSLNWINTDLEINCILWYNMFNPRWQNILNIYVIWVVDNTKKEINNCSSLSDTDTWNTIQLNIEQDFVQDFSVNKSIYTEIISDFIYAPTRNNGWSEVWNYIYTEQHILSTNIDSDNTLIVTDEDLLHGRDIYLLSAEPLNEYDLTCNLVGWPEWLEINPNCKITANNTQNISMWIIHSCGSIWCENNTCTDWNGCRWNNQNWYKKIKAPFKYQNKLHISSTVLDTNQLQNWDTRIIRIALKENQGCFNRQDGTNSTYIKIKFKKILSPYKAWYLSWDNGWVRYTSKNLWNALKSWGKDIWFLRYISNPQTAKSWDYSWWNIDKINYEINFNTWVADENYHIVWGATIWSYNKQIIIIKPTFRKINPESYKFIFPKY